MVLAVAMGLRAREHVILRLHSSMRRRAFARVTDSRTFASLQFFDVLRKATSAFLLQPVRALSALGVTPERSIETVSE
jgi:hypothetical protein